MTAARPRQSLTITKVKAMIIENTQRRNAEQQVPVNTEALDLAWGAREIARLIGKTPRATFHLLEQGQIPGARKVGRQWLVSRKVLRAHFEGAM